MKKIILFISIIILVFSGKTYGTFYVVQALTGNDSNPGTLALPWLTIQHAADVMVAGDVVLIRGGIYNENIVTRRSGNSSSGYIAFMAYTGENPIIDGTDTTVGNYAFQIHHDYIYISGLEIRNWRDVGIWAENDSSMTMHNIYIENCNIHDIANYCISFKGRIINFGLLNDDLHHYGIGGNGAGFDESNDYSDSTMNAYNGVIRNCRAHDELNNDNIDGFALGHTLHRNITFDHDSAYNVGDGFDITGHNILLDGCVAHDCIYGGSFKLWSDSLYLTNCIAYHSNTNAELEDNPTVHYWNTPKKVTLMNCIFFKPLGGNNLGILPNCKMDTLAVYNCIIADGLQGLNLGDTGLLHVYRGDYNLFQNIDTTMLVNSPTVSFSMGDFADGAWTAATGQDAHSRLQYNCFDIFADTLLPNLHSKSTSLAIDNGTPAGAPAVDFDSCSRPMGSGFDIGAYEYGCQAGIAEINNGENQVKVYPNPSNGAFTIDLGLSIYAQEIHITDILGNLVLKQTVNKQGKFDIKNIPAGIYLLIITDDNHRNITRKIIIL